MSLVNACRQLNIIPREAGIAETFSGPVLKPTRELALLLVRHDAVAVAIVNHFLLAVSDFLDDVLGVILLLENFHLLPSREALGSLVHLLHVVIHEASLLLGQHVLVCSVRHEGLNSFGGAFELLLDVVRPGLPNDLQIGITVACITPLLLMGLQEFLKLNKHILLCSLELLDLLLFFDCGVGVSLVFLDD